MSRLVSCTQRDICLQGRFSLRYWITEWLEGGSADTHQETKLPLCVYLRVCICGNVRDVCLLISSAVNRNLWCCFSDTYMLPFACVCVLFLCGSSFMNKRNRKFWRLKLQVNIRLRVIPPHRRTRRVHLLLEKSCVSHSYTHKKTCLCSQSALSPFWLYNTGLQIRNLPLNGFTFCKAYHTFSP